MRCHPIYIYTHTHTRTNSTTKWDTQYVNKSQTQDTKKQVKKKLVIKKASVSIGLLKKGLKQAVASNTMHSHP